MEQEIIQPVSRELLKGELTPERRMRMTNKSHNEIYVVTAQEAPNVMLEIGRLREEAFRTAGGGTGKSADIDEFDTMENGCRQLIVWNPEVEEIIGGYRYLIGTDWKIDDKGQPVLATSHMFHFSEKFMTQYAPYTVELGRSFVSLGYQNVRKTPRASSPSTTSGTALAPSPCSIPTSSIFSVRLRCIPAISVAAEI